MVRRGVIILKISACVITKNEEFNIIKWLNCMKKIADEMILVDTGSNDNTVNIAKKYGAITYEINWENDFSVAKNFAIDKATGEWIVFLDADEYFTNESIDHVRKYIFEADSKKMDAIICKIVNINEDENCKVISSFYNLRIFKNHSSLRYKNKVHEMLTKNGELKLLQVVNDVEIYHTGYSTGRIKKKLERNLKILLDEIDEFGEKSWQYGFLTDCYYGLKDYENAIKYAKLAINSEVRLAGQENNVYRRLIDSMMAIGTDYVELLSTVDKAIILYPQLPEFIYDKAVIKIKQKKYAEAEDLFVNSLKKNNEIIKLPNIYTDNFTGRINLLYCFMAEIYLVKNNLAKAIEFFTESLRINKYNALALSCLYKLIKKEEPIDIIDFLNSLYDETETDLKFLLETLNKVGVSKVSLYYENKLKKSHNNDLDNLSIDKLIIAEKYQEATTFLKSEMDKAYEILAYDLADKLNINEKEKINLLTPMKYKKHFTSIEEAGVNNIFVTIIIDNCNSAVCIKDNLGEIAKFTKSKYEIFVITKKENKLLNEMENIKQIIISEKDNKISIYNDIIKQAYCSHVLFLDSEVLVTPNYINKMLEKLNKEKKSVAIGPLFNNIIGQSIEIPQLNVDLIEFATKIEKVYLNKFEKRLFLAKQCLLIKKNALQEVGLFDEAMEEEAIWDDLFCRFIKGGYYLLLALDTFVYNNGADYIKRSFFSFKEKWGFDFCYSTVCRMDLLNMMDFSKANINVLEVGCACGGTLLEIKNRNMTANLYGIEINDKAASISKMIANVSAADIESAELPYEKNFFDYVIFGDVLEHLYDPVMVLKNLKDYLKDDGKIIASIPNIQHWSIIEGLLEGSWQYTDAGILDKTHVRFFTRSGITDMFNNACYEVLQYVGKNVGITEKAQTIINKLSLNKMVDQIDDFMVYQWLVEAKKQEILSLEDEQELIYLLRRLDNAIDKKENLELLRLFILEKKIKYELLVELINISLINKSTVLIDLAISIYEKQTIKNSIQLLIEGYRKYKENIDIIYTLAYLLNSSGDRESAIKLLESSEIKDENTEKLLAELKEA